MEPFSEDISLLAEKLGELQSRLSVLTEREGLAMASIEAVEASQKSSLVALEAALAGVVALDQQNPGVAALREIRNLSASTSGSIATLESKIAAVADVAKQLGASDGEIAKAAAAEVAAARTELAGNISQLSTALEALRQEFAARDRLNPCGCYEPGKKYNRLDLVELNGSSYISTEDNNTDKPSKKSRKWMLSAGRGGTMAIGGAPVGGVGVGVEDGDKGEIEVSSGGTTWSVKAAAIDDAKVAADAGIAWTKIDKTGAAKTDVGLGNVDNTADASKPISAAQQAALDAKAAAASPTFTGPVTSPGAIIAAGTAMTGEQINVALRDNLYSATGNVTWTHSATPAIGQIYGVTVSTDGTARTITLPVTAYSSARGANITDVTFPANATHTVFVKRTATGYQILGDPLTSLQIAELIGLSDVATSGDAADLTGTIDPDVVATGTALQIVRRNSLNTAFECVDAGTGTGDVLAASNFGTDNRVIRSDGTSKGVQASSVEIDDSGNIGPVSDSIPNHVAFWDADASSPKAIRFTAPTAITTEYTVIWPSAPGTVGQLLSVASVSGGIITLQFVTV
jgi:hypothetical protein